MEVPTEDGTSVWVRKCMCLGSCLRAYRPLHVQPYNVIVLPVSTLTLPTQIGRRTGELCAEFPYVLLVVLALVLFLVAIIPIPVFVMVITKKKFRVSFSSYQEPAVCEYVYGVLSTGGGIRQ